MSFNTRATGDNFNPCECDKIPKKQIRSVKPTSELRTDLYARKISTIPRARSDLGQYVCLSANSSETAGHIFTILGECVVLIPGMVLIYFLEVTDPHEGPHPYGQSQNRWIFLSPTRCKGGGHSFCPIHTKFSALNILNAQNCWVFFQKLGIKTSLRHEPSNFNRSWEKSDLLKVIYISEFLTTFLKYPTL